LTDGWTLPTNAEWLSSFADTAAVYNAFTLNGTGQLCASSYFDSGYDHCDSGDVQAGYIWDAPAPIGNSDSSNPASDSFLVRGVPEPSSVLLLLGMCLATVIARRRLISAPRVNAQGVTGPQRT
jgi:hypothetical protein